MRYSIFFSCLLKVYQIFLLRSMAHSTIIQYLQKHQRRHLSMPPLDSPPVASTSRIGMFALLVSSRIGMFKASEMSRFCGNCIYALGFREIAGGGWECGNVEVLPTANTNTQWSCARPRCAMALCCRCDSFDKAIHPIYCSCYLRQDRQLPSCVKVHLGPTIPVCHSWRPRMPFAVGKGTFANSSGLCKVQLAVVCDYLQVDKVSCPVSAWFRHSMKLLLFGGVMPLSPF